MPGAVRATTARVATALLVALVLTASLVLVTPRTAAAAINPSQLLWLIKSNDLAALDQQAANDGVTLPAFSWVGCGGQSDVDRCLAGQVPIFTSYWGLAARAQAGWRGTAVYDIEPWRFTPLGQRQNPDKWICRAAQLQQTDPGLKVVITPFARPPRPLMISEDVQAAKCGAYGVDIQSQFANNLPGTFSTFIHAAVRAIRHANAKTEILAGLATNSPNLVTADEMTADYHSALAAGVQGFWLNANDWFGSSQCTAAQGGLACPETAIRFLEYIGMITTGAAASTPTPSPTTSTPTPAPSTTPTGTPSPGNGTAPAKPASHRTPGRHHGAALQREFVRLIIDSQLARLVGGLAVIAASGFDAWVAGDLVIGKVHQV